MRGVWPHEQDEERAFADKAAKHFAQNPGHFTYGGDVKPGDMLALRWGLDNDGVVVLKLSEDYTPVNYYGLITQHAAGRPQVRFQELVEALQAWQAWAWRDETGILQKESGEQFLSIAKSRTEAVLQKVMGVRREP